MFQHSEDELIRMNENIMINVQFNFSYYILIDLYYTLGSIHGEIPEQQYQT